MKTRKETISISQIILLLAVCVCGFSACRNDSDNNTSLDDNGPKVETPVLMGVVEKGPFVISKVLKWSPICFNWRR